MEYQKDYSVNEREVVEKISLFSFLRKVLLEPFRFWKYAIDEFFDGDQHHIVSKEGWRILNTLNSKELKEFIEKHKDL